MQFEKRFRIALFLTKTISTSTEVCTQATTTMHYRIEKNEVFKQKRFIVR